jgi:RNA polymerase sigma factor (sigma-70 family)
MPFEAIPDASNHAQFATTHWSMVVAAADKESPQVNEALTALCTTYWYPLYAYARRLGNEAHQAQDLTQAFFTQFLEKDYLKAVNREHGKFRTFLLVSFRNFLANEHDRNNAQKRGGGRSVLSLDLEAAEWRTRLEPSHSLTAERLFERRWALTLLEQTLARLRAEFTTSGKGSLFDHMKGCLTGEKPGIRTQELADRLGMTAGAINVAVHRLRQRYKDLLREEIARTVSDPAEIDGEIRDLFMALG